MAPRFRAGRAPRARRSRKTFRREPGGSNGIAIAPSNTTAHHALLLINPHTSFFFRSELQMTSDEGLNAYGAATWGQFFIYQGFNEHAGWMHTSSGVDDIDEYLETVVKKGDRYFYKYGSEERPVTTIDDHRAVQDAARAWRRRRSRSTARSTGPSSATLNGKWVSFALMQEPVKALTQSFSRTKAQDYKAFKQTMELHTNSSNNTIFADADGDIAYFHGNFIPRRDPKFDWTKPVDGSDPATDWHGLLSVDETPHLLNPAERLALQHQQLAVVGGRPSSPKQADFPDVRRQRRRVRARPARDPGAAEQEGLHARRPRSRRPTTAI